MTKRIRRRKLYRMASFEEYITIQRYKGFRRLRRLSISIGQVHKIKARRFFKTGKLVFFKRKLKKTTLYRKFLPLFRRKLTTQPFRFNLFYYRRNLITKSKTLYRRKRRSRRFRKLRRRIGRRYTGRQSYSFPRKVLSGEVPLTSYFVSAPISLTTLTMVRNKSNFWGMISTPRAGLVYLSSAGQFSGTTGSRRGTSYAASEVARDLSLKFNSFRRQWALRFINAKLSKPWIKRPRRSKNRKQIRVWRRWRKKRFAWPKMRVQLCLKNWYRSPLWKLALREFFKPFVKNKCIKMRVSVKFNKTHNGMRPPKKRRL